MKTRRAISAVIAVASMTLIVACGVKREKPPRSGDEDDQESAPAADTGMPSPLGNLGMFSSMLGDNLGQPGPYDELRESEDFDDDDPHFGVLELSGPIVEMQSFSWFAPPSGMELRALTDKLDTLAAADHVRGLIIRAGDISLTMAAAEELRAALLRFRGDGSKRLACHTERLSNISYYVFSACDSIAMAPLGELMISGVVAVPIHLKDMLAKLGMRADFVHIGAYKGAAEPLTRDAPSAEMVETLQAIIDQNYQTMVTGIAQGRSLEPERVRELIDNAVFRSEEAVAAKLADEVSVYSAYRDSIVGDTGWHRVKVGEGMGLGMDGPPDIAKLMEFVGIKPRPRPSKPHVALVYALGNIVDGKGQGVMGARGEIASRTLSAAIDALGRDEKVEAIVLRVDSPGGSALASELILNSLDVARKAKPVIVSMGGVAASGGYYISCHGTKVFASETTITGSIGVVGGKLVMDETLDMIGVKAYPMARGKRALMGSMLAPFTPEERALIEEEMGAVYKTFVGHVAAGRDKHYEAVHEVAQGRVWTGAAALEHGLIDEIGGLDAALAAAREMGGVDPETDVEVYPPEPTLMDIMGSFGEAQAASVRLGDVEVEARVARWLAAIAGTLGAPEARVIETTLRQLARLQDARASTVMFFPVIFY